MSNQTIADHDTPDPWMLFHDNAYYLTFTAGDRVEIWKSLDMENFRTGDVQKAVAFKPPAVNPWVVDLWAPELHYLDAVDSSAAQDTDAKGNDNDDDGNDGNLERHKRKTWYIYFTGANPAHAGGGTYNAARRTLLLRCKGPDPMAPEAWEFLGQVKGLSEDRWNIDATVFYYSPLETTPHQGEEGSQQQQQQTLGPGTKKRKLYCCFSAWPVGDLSDTQQDLFLVEMINPEIARPETEVCISRAELSWERTEDDKHGVNEGPTFINIPPTPSSSSSASPQGFHGIIYSANGSWTSNYRLGVLQLVGADPLQASSWRKRENPLLVSDRAYGGPFGPGHASFIVPSSVFPSESTVTGAAEKIYCIYHATEFEHQGWDNRKARVLGFKGETFLPGAETVCCALALTGRTHDAGTAADPGTGPTAAGVSSTAANGASPEASSGRAGHSRRKSLLERIWGKARELAS